MVYVFPLCPDQRCETEQISFSEYEFLQKISWMKLRNFLSEGRRDDFKGHTNHRILPNYINGSNWNKMFAYNIFGSEGSYLMGEVCI